VTENCDRDPGWDSHHNGRRYETANVRPRFDFGYSAVTLVLAESDRASETQFDRFGFVTT